MSCGQIPVKLVDYLPDVPDAGRSAVQVPTIIPAGDVLFYVLNWYFPLEAGGGGGGYLMRVPVRGGEPVRMALIEGGGSGSGQGLDATPTGVVFGEAGAGGSQGAIVSVPAGGGDRVTLGSTSGVANAVVANDRDVFFVDGGGTKSVPIAGGSVRMLTAQKPYSILVDGWTLYLAEYQAMGTVSSVPVDGGQLSVLATDPNGAIHPVRCGETLCWMSGPPLNARLRQLDRDGSVTTLADGLSQPHDLVFDGTSFFVSTGGGGLSLYRIPATGGQPVLIHADGGLSSLALDDACLYWSSFDGIYSWALSAANRAPDINL